MNTKYINTLENNIKEIEEIKNFIELIIKTSYAGSLVLSDDLHYLNKKLDKLNMRKEYIIEKIFN